MKEYVQQLQGLSPAALAAATQEAVQQWEDCAARVEAVAARLPTAPAVAGLPATLPAGLSWTAGWQCLPRDRQHCNWRLDRAEKTWTEPSGSWKAPSAMWSSSLRPRRRKKGWPAARRQEHL